jgi:hypothetical protein
MQKYIKQYHTTGLAWNPKGVDYSQVASGAAPAAAAGIVSLFFFLLKKMKRNYG